MNEDKIASAFIEGYDSRTSGTGSCRYTQGSDEYYAWHFGFSDGADEAAVVILAVRYSLTPYPPAPPRPRRYLSGPSHWLKEQSTNHPPSEP